MFERLWILRGSFFTLVIIIVWILCIYIEWQILFFGWLLQLIGSESASCISLPYTMLIIIRQSSCYANLRNSNFYVRYVKINISMQVVWIKYLQTHSLDIRSLFRKFWFWRISRSILFFYWRVKRITSTFWLFIEYHTAIWNTDVSGHLVELLYVCAICRIPTAFWLQFV